MKWRLIIKKRMNKNKTLIEVNKFLKLNFKNIFNSFKKYQCLYRNGNITSKAMVNGLTACFKRFDKDFHYYIGNREFEFGVFMDNEHVTNTWNLLIFSNFVMFRGIRMSPAPKQVLKNRIRMKEQDGYFYYFPIEEAHFIDGDLYCYSRKPTEVGRYGLWDEKALQNYLIQSIEKIEGWDCIKLHPSKYGKGVPDVMVTKPDGSNLYIELKSPRGTGLLTMEQILYHEKLREQGEIVKVIWQKKEIDNLLGIGNFEN